MTEPITDPMDEGVPANSAGDAMSNLVLADIAEQVRAVKLENFDLPRQMTAETWKRLLNLGCPNLFYHADRASGKDYFGNGEKFIAMAQRICVLMCPDFKSVEYGTAVSDKNKEFRNVAMSVFADWGNKPPKENLILAVLAGLSWHHSEFFSFLDVGCAKI